MKNFTLTLATLMLLNIVVTNAQQPGTLDLSFGKKGITTTDPSSYQADAAYSVALQTDGKIVVTGHATSTCCDGEVSGDYATVRYTPDGKVDSAFGTNGVVLTNFLGKDYSDDFGFSVAIQADGKIVVAGTCWNDTSGYNFGLARYTSQGILDSSFGIDGRAQTDLNNGWARSVIIQPDGKIVAGGNAYVTTGRRLTLARFTKKGNPDNAFGINGTVSSSLTDDCQGYSVALQDDGKILIAGIDNATHDFVIARFTKNGMPDSSFNLNGIVISNLKKSAYNSSNLGASMTVQPDGKIVITGSVSNGSNYDIALMRYLPNGKPDKDFGNKGTVLFNNGANDWGFAVKLQVNGKIVVAGESNNTFSLVRFKQTGKLDSTFGTNGRVITDFKKSYSEALTLAMQPDGKIVAAGQSGGRFAVVRYFGYLPAEDDNISNVQKQTSIKSIALLSPNPVKDVLHVQGLSSNHLKLILLINADGRLLQRATTISSTQSFNVKQLPAGIYFIKIEENNTSTTLRFMKE